MSEKKFYIRLADNEDTAEIFDVHSQSIMDLCSKDYSPEEIASWTSGRAPDSYQAAMEGGEKLFVAVADGKIIGFSGVKDDEVRAVYVHPQWAGTGVGSSLLKRAEEELVALGQHTIKLDATLTAHQFYLRNGWIEIRRCTHTLGSGLEIACIAMQKQV